MSSTTITELDVTKIIPQEKHATIFRTFDALNLGESFILVNDHDPRPLQRQFDTNRLEQYNWEYLEQGPATWKIRLTKTK